MGNRIRKPWETTRETRETGKKVLEQTRTCQCLFSQSIAPPAQNNLEVPERGEGWYSTSYTLPILADSPKANYEENRVQLGGIYRRLLIVVALQCSWEFGFSALKTPP